MDLEDAKCYAIVGTIIILGILSFLLPICIFVNIGEQRDMELEKYKIEMQYKHGDVVEEKEEVK